MEEEDEEMEEEDETKICCDGALLDMVDMQNLMVVFLSKRSNG